MSSESPSRRPDSAHSMSFGNSKLAGEGSRENLEEAGYDHAAMMVPAALPKPDESNQTSKILGNIRPRVKKLWHQRYIKILVVGDSGLGKTTLVRSLLAVPGQKVDLHDGSETSFDEFQKNPDNFLSSIDWTNDEDCVRWTYQVQDTPGYGDSLDLAQNVDRIREYINNQNEKWFQLENDRNREELSEVLDPRVDLCIFCLPPHRLRNIDLLFMHEISQDVPVLPVVTKADTMTIKEANAYRAAIHRRLERPVLEGRKGPINVFAFSSDTMEAVGCPDDSVASSVRPPYLVVCSNQYDEERMKQATPELWPHRQYMWGTSEAFNPLHSDLLLLRRLLLQDGVEEIVVTKRRRYEEWRSRRMHTGVKPLRGLVRLAIKAAVTVAVIAGLAHATGRVNLPKAMEGAMHPVENKPITAGAVDYVVEKAVETKDFVVEKSTDVKDLVTEKIPQRIKQRADEPEVVVATKQPGMFGRMFLGKK